MKKLTGLLPALCLLGCATMGTLAEPPRGMVTAEVLAQVLESKPEWVGPAQNIANAVLERAGDSPTLDRLEMLAYDEIDARYESPEIRRQGREYVKRVRAGLEADLAATSGAEQAVQLALFVAWLAGSGG